MTHMARHLDGYLGCPYCGSLGVLFGTAVDDPAGDLISDGYCKECERRWRDRYKVVEVIEIGPDGKPIMGEVLSETFDH